MSNDGGYGGSYGGGHGHSDDPYGYGEPQYPGDYQQQQYPTEQFPAGQQYGQQYGQQQPYPTQQYPVVPSHQPPGNNQRPILIGLGAVVIVGVVVIILAIAGVFSGDSKTVADPTPTTSLSPTVDFPSTSVTSDPTSAFPSPSISSSDPISSPTTSSSLGALCPNADPIRTVRLFVSGITLSSLDISAGCLASGSATSRSDVQSIIASGQKYSPTVDSSQTGPTFTFTSVDDSHKLTVRVQKQSDGKYYVVSASQS